MNTAQPLPEEEKTLPSQTDGGEPIRPRRKFHFAPAFWTIASTLSVIVNVILIIIVIILAINLFTLKQIVGDQLVNGLYNNFQLMDAAHIKTTIPVSASVPAKFDLPLETDTTVVLTEDTYIPDAQVSVYTGGLQIMNARTDIVLPKDTKLPVHLSMVVPVDQQIPVELNVNVDIPLNQTELHQPFVGLQGVVAPFKELLDPLPGNWQELMCGESPSPFCKSIFKK
jgi:hypothetical protein